MLFKPYPTALRLLHEAHSGYTEIPNSNTVQKKKPQATLHTRSASAKNLIR